MKRSFEDIIESLKDSIATYQYYVDFEKVYLHVSEVEKQLNLLNYLIGKENIEAEFSLLITEYPQVLSAIPILLAIREGNIKIIDGEFISFSFNKTNRDLKDYIKLFRETGLEKLFKEKKIKNLVDYVTGVEVGLDTNARKNRTGKFMEEIVEGYIKKIPNIDYLRQASKSDIAKHYNTNVLDSLILDQENGKTNKRFDFAFKNKNDELILIETNYYSGSGSKLNETARSYKMIAEESKSIKNFSFVWITDGGGWRSARRNLEETFNVLDNLYNIYDLESLVLEKLFG